MSQQELVRLVVGALQNASIDYMVTGSWASSMSRWMALFGGSEKHLGLVTVVIR
jgi:hypothetical protein